MAEAQDDLTKRIDAILNLLRERLGPQGTAGGLSAEQQDLAGRLINALPYLPRLKSARINIGQAEIAAAAVLRPEPQLKLAEDIIADLERRVEIYKSVFKSVREGRSPISQLLLGVALHALILTGLMSIVGLYLAYGLRPAPSTDIELDWTIFWVMVAGSVGGITSLLVRLHDFAVVSRWSPDADPKVLFFTGLLKPAVGIVFALFVWMVLESGLVSLNFANVNPQLRAVALAFVAGFSERFAPDLANRAGSAVVGPPGAA